MTCGLTADARARITSGSRETRASVVSFTWVAPGDIDQLGQVASLRRHVEVPEGTGETVDDTEHSRADSPARLLPDHGELGSDTALQSLRLFVVAYGPADFLDGCVNISDRLAWDNESSEAKDVEPVLHERGLVVRHDDQVGPEARDFLQVRVKPAPDPRQGLDLGRVAAVVGD